MLKNRKIIYAVIPAVIVLFFNLLIFNRYFPLSEGWWEAYGYMINNGLKLFKDLDLALSPLFVVYSAFLLKLTGNSFFVIRLVGVFAFTLDVALLHLFLRRFFPALESCIAVLFASFFFILSPQFIAKDYHTYLHLATVVWLLILVISVRRPRDIFSWFIDASVGGLVIVIFFLKQNVGVLLFASILVHFSFFASASSRWSRFFRLVCIAVGAAVAFLIMNSLIGFNMSLIHGNDSKGSLVTVLLRCVTNAANRWTVVRAFILAAVSITFYPYILRMQEVLAALYAEHRKSLDGWILWDNTFKVKHLIVFAGVIAVVSGRFRNIALQWIIPIVLSVLVVHVYKYIWNRRHSVLALTEEQGVVLLPLCALAYANTNTAVFDPIGLFEVIAYGSATLLVVSRLISINLRNFIVTVMVAFVSFVFIHKIINPYTWWGNQQGNIISANQHLAYKELNGIYVDPNTKRAFAAVKSSIERYSKGPDDVYLFNLPLFYLLEKKMLPGHGRLPVQWFDVVTKAQMERDLQNLRTSRPAVIVIYEPSDMAFIAHRAMKKVDTLVQERLINQVDQWVYSGEYIFDKSIALHLPKKSLENLKVVSVRVIVQNHKLVNQTVSELAGSLSFASNNINILAHADYNLVRVKYGVTRKARVALGDNLTISGSREKVENISEKLGVAKGAGREWNTVTIYIRKDRFLEVNHYQNTHD